VKLEINRAEWLRGDNMHSCLLRERDSKRCCLGIYGRALGIPDRFMLEEVEPVRWEADSRDGDEFNAGRNEAGQLWPSWLCLPAGFRASRTDEQRIIEVNDDPDLDEPERETAIASIFARHGVEVAFVDGPEPKTVK
jgi:hypothetical protein